MSYLSPEITSNFSTLEAVFIHLFAGSCGIFAGILLYNIYKKTK